MMPSDESADLEIQRQVDELIGSDSEISEAKGTTLFISERAADVLKRHLTATIHLSKTPEERSMLEEVIEALQFDEE